MYLRSFPFDNSLPCYEIARACINHQPRNLEGDEVCSNQGE